MTHCASASTTCRPDAVVAVAGVDVTVVPVVTVSCVDVTVVPVVTVSCVDVTVVPVASVTVVSCVVVVYGVQEVQHWLATYAVPQ